MNCNSLDQLKVTNHMYLKMIEFDLWASIDAKPKKTCKQIFPILSCHANNKLTIAKYNQYKTFVEVFHALNFHRFLKDMT